MTSAEILIKSSFIETGGRLSYSPSGTYLLWPSLAFFRSVRKCRTERLPRFSSWKTSPICAKSCVTILEREGFKVIESEDGEAGLALLRKHLPKIVLLDIMLPGMDGVEICRSIKYDPQTRSIPVIMVTARGDESDIVLGLGVGADDYIVKPFSPRELVARIKAVLRRAKFAMNPEPTNAS